MKLERATIRDLALLPDVSAQVFRIVAFRGFENLKEIGAVMLAPESPVAAPVQHVAPGPNGS